MFKKSDKRRLYWLIDLYLSEEINAWTFCNEFHIIYDIEINYKKLTKLEYEAFSQLAKVASRFTDIEEDLIKYPGVYHTKEELTNAIIEIQEKLKKEST